MKNIPFLLFINIVGIIFLLFIFEIPFFMLEYDGLIKNSPQDSTNNYSILDFAKDFYGQKKYINEQSEIRRPAGLEYINNKPAIVIFGCSFAYGTGLSEEEHFGKILSDYTKSPVFNLALGGGSPREALYILRNDKLLSEKIQNKNNIKYVIYLYIPDHKTRLYANLRPVSPNFAKNQNSLVIKNINFFDKSIAIRRINRFLYEVYYKNNAFDLISLYLKEINKEIKKNFSYGEQQTKLIIVIYDEDPNDDWQKFENDYCKDNNVKIISIKKLLGKDISNIEEFQIEDKNHPNKKAWELVVPALTKELRL